MEAVAKRRQRLKQILATLKTVHADAKLDLDFSHPLELLIALILAAQARDDLINSVTAELFKKYRTPADWAGENTEKLHQLLGKINFYRNKTKAIQGACTALIERF